jgi:hypothetical protein
VDPIRPIERSDRRVQPVDLPRLTPLEREQEKERREQARKRRGQASKRRGDAPNGLDVRA